MKLLEIADKSRVAGLQLAPFRTVLLLLIFSPTLLVASEPQGKLTGPQLFPEKTLAYLRVDDVRQLRKDYERSSLGKLSKDTKLKPFIDEFYGSLISVTEQSFGQIGLNLDEFLSIPSGELAFALLAAPANSRIASRSRREGGSSKAGVSPQADGESQGPEMVPPVFAMMVDAGEDISGIKIMLRRLDQSMAGKSDHFQRNFDRLTLHSYQNIEDDQKQFAYFIDQGVLIAATHTKTIEDLALVWLGQAGNRKTLADNRRFISLMKRCVGTEGERPQISFYMDPLAMLRAVVPDNPATMMMMAVLPALGLDGFQALGGSWILAPNEFDSIGHLHILLNHPRTGVLELLRPQAGSTAPEKWIPNNVSAYATINWDLQSTLLGVERLINQFRGEDGLNQEVFVPLQKRTGIDFRNGFVEQMEGRISFFQGYVQPITADSQSNVIAIRMKNIQEFQREWLPKLFDWMSKEAAAETAQFGSLRAHIFRAGKSRLPIEAPLTSRQQESCIAILDDYIVISDSAFMMQQIAEAQRDPDRRLVDSLEFQLIMDRIQAHLHGKQACAIAYLQPDEQLRSFYELLRDPEKRQGLEQWDRFMQSDRTLGDSGQGNPDAESASRSLAKSNPFYRALNEALKKQELPPYAEISKHLAPQGGFLVEEDTGLHFTAFALRRE